jgi:hypothetical protein
MNIGSLYRVKKAYWLLFPSKESATTTAAATAPATAFVSAAGAAAVAAYYSKEYKENVTWFSLDSYIVFLEEDGKFRKFLTSEGLIGWTWFAKDYNDYFEEVKSE